MTDDEIIAVVQAHKDGKKIQAATSYLSDKEDAWIDVHLFGWNFEQFCYRVAPERRKPREWWVHVSDSGEKIESALWGIPMCDKCVKVREIIE